MNGYFSIASKVPAHILVALIRFYQRCISPALGPRCRFYPTCSEYTRLCIARQGVLIGGARSIVRLCKCQPWHPGGVDLPFSENTDSPNLLRNLKHRNLTCGQD